MATIDPRETARAARSNRRADQQLRDLQEENSSLRDQGEELIERLGEFRRENARLRQLLKQHKINPDSGEISASPSPKPKKGAGKKKPKDSKKKIAPKRPSIFSWAANVAHDKLS